jgi:hypothetical protein
VKEQKKPRGFPWQVESELQVLLWEAQEASSKQQKTTGEVHPWQRNPLPELPGLVHRGADSQQAHPIDLFADKFSVLVHKLARLLSVLMLIRVYHEGQEESR